MIPLPSSPEPSLALTEMVTTDGRIFAATAVTWLAFAELVLRPFPVALAVLVEPVSDEVEFDPLPLTA